MGRFSKYINWFVERFVGRVRFWSEKEWENRTEKEKLWIWYKHHWKMKNEGSAEIDQLTNPIKELILYGGIIVLLFVATLEAIGINLNFLSLMATVAVSCILLWTVVFLLQWYVGNWKDRNDFIALNTELDNKRNILFRDFRTGIVKYKVKK